MKDIPNVVILAVIAVIVVIFIQYFFIY